MTFKEIRQASGMNLTQFSEYFEIPYRTLQHWEHGTRQCPEYLLKLMQYKLNIEKETEITAEQIKAMKHIVTSEGDYCSVYECEETGVQYLITIDSEDGEIYYISKVLN